MPKRIKKPAITMTLTSADVQRIVAEVEFRMTAMLEVQMEALLLAMGFRKTGELRERVHLQ